MWKKVGGGKKILKKVVTSFMEGPLLNKSKMYYVILKYIMLENSYATKTNL